MPLYELLRPAMGIWYALSLKHASSVPRPRDLPTWRPAAEPADAVLMIGNGPCHGWGVATHGLALTGQLGRAIAERTGRPCSVDYVGDEAMNLASALPWIGDRDLSAYDTFVVVIGVNDAVRLTPVADWSRRLRRLLATLLERAAPGARILVAGTQPPRSVPIYAGPLGAVADRHALELNRATEEAAGEDDRISYFPLPAVRLGGARPFGSPEVYAEWAALLADAAVPVLEAARRSDPTRNLPDLSPVTEWAGIDRAIELAAEGGSEELQRIAGVARRRFGVEIATVSIVDGDRLRYAVPGGLPSVVPLELTFCRYAVQEPEPTIVPDARRDPRFAGNPLLELGHMQFYAGHPLQSLSGEPIGTLCLMGARPKSASSVDLGELRSLALEAQQELWRIEREAAAPAVQLPAQPGPAADAAAQAEKTTRSR